MPHRTPEEWARIEADGIDRERLNAFTDEDIAQQAREDGMPIGEDEIVDTRQVLFDSAFIRSEVQFVRGD
jgi:hypothetical protein